MLLNDEPSASPKHKFKWADVGSGMGSNIVPKLDAGKEGWPGSFLLNDGNTFKEVLNCAN